MGIRAEVFISATSADLGSYRQVAKEALLTLGAHPIEEKNFPTDYRELHALLARRLVVNVWMCCFAHRPVAWLA